MHRSSRGVTLAGAILVVGMLLSAWPAQGGNEVFDARGFIPGRPTASQLPFEHVDPLTGNLLLVFTDLSLPGNAGFDLQIQRSYNSKIFLTETFGPLESDSWAGVGWLLHLGRVRTAQDESPIAVEMPDGSSHKLFPNFVGDSGKFVTRDYWLYDRSGVVPTLKLTNGAVYTLDKFVTFSNGNCYRYATRIQDPFGNRIDIEYDTLTAAPDAIKKVTQYLGPPGNPGSQKREITFTTQTSGSRTRLRTMTYLARTWTYTYVASTEADKSLLTSVQPPAGPAWSFSYVQSGGIQNELVRLTTPSGGTVTWTYGTQGAGSGALANPFYLGSSAPVRSRVVTSRTTGGRAVTAGTFAYAYAQGSALNQSAITEPVACTGSTTTTTYTFLGVGNGYATSSVWSIGLLARRQTKQGSSILETEDLGWRSPLANDIVSPYVETVGPNTDYGVYAPVIQTRSITRGSGNYLTSYSYHSQPYAAGGPNFNDYGRPWQVVETGDAGTRTTVRTFTYGFTPYIVDKVGTETLTIGSESFKRSWAYAPVNGFLTDEYGWGNTSTSGIHTTFAPTTDGKGNLGSITDGNGHSTSRYFDSGVLARVVTPAHPTIDTLARTINPEGTIKDETRYNWNGNSLVQATTSYLYDGLFRQTSKTPPAGNQIVTTYDNANGSSVTVTRGPNAAGLTSSVVTTLDGFGRPSATQNSVGVKTALEYDACDRLSYESYPYSGTNNRGVAYSYDGLGRVTRKTNTTDNTYSSLSYTGLDLTLADENEHQTQQDWAAFGDTGDARLVSVTAGLNTTDENTTTYAYNALGSLTAVTQPGGVVRTWNYFATNGLLKTETHPESGAVSYTYDGAGNPYTRTDPAFGTTTYAYDANNRRTGITRPASNPAWPYYNTTSAYDPSDNRYSSSSSYVSSALAFDQAGRLIARTDTLKPTGAATPARPLTTTYGYDGNDFLTQLAYPSPSSLSVTYVPDSEGRIVSIGKPGVPGFFAQSFSYHPSGGIQSYTAGNGLQHVTIYDGRNRVDTTNAGGALALNYGYDDVGNPTTIDETTRPGMNLVFTYDALDRLETAGGYGASTAFGYDARGNRITKTVNGQTTTYNYHGTTRRLASLTGGETGTYGYDNFGNTIQDPLGQYTYTPESLTETATTGAATTTYRYDPDGLRAMKIQGGWSYYVHGPQGQLLGEYREVSGAAQAERAYVYAGSRSIASVRPTVPPFGYLDTPAEGASGLAGAIAVTGWALDDRGVTRVSIWRDPAIGEASGPGPNGQVYLGDGIFIQGARPDVAAAYPSYPNATRAGWGLAVLTNLLPGQGNGSLTLYAYAHDEDGNQTPLGTKHVTVDNAHSTKPFGTLDTPAQGQTVSGSAYVVFGWALTPQPGVIPIDGSTIWYLIDGQYVGHPVYNQYRSDIAGLFPGYANSNGAVGYSIVDTTHLTNGIHTIMWLVTDNLGRAEGLGSRFFWVQN